MENSNYKSKKFWGKILKHLYDWLINYIAEPIRNCSGFKDKIVSAFITNTHRQTVFAKRTN